MWGVVVILSIINVVGSILNVMVWCDQVDTDMVWVCECEYPRACVCACSFVVHTLHTSSNGLDAVANVWVSATLQRLYIVISTAKHIDLEIEVESNLSYCMHRMAQPCNVHLMVQALHFEQQVNHYIYYIFWMLASTRWRLVLMPWALPKILFWSKYPFFVWTQLMQLTVRLMTNLSVWVCDFLYGSLTLDV